MWFSDDLFRGREIHNWKLDKKHGHLKGVFGGEAKLLILDMETNWNL